MSQNKRKSRLQRVLSDNRITPEDILVGLSQLSCCNSKADLQFKQEEIPPLLNVFSKLLESNGPKEQLEDALGILLKSDISENVLKYLHELAEKNEAAETHSAARQVKIILDVAVAAADFYALLEDINKVKSQIKEIICLIDASNYQMVLNEFKIEKTLEKLELQLNRSTECSEGHELFKQIIPTQNELEALPVNIVDQPYESIEHYRKTHYKLLHEDLIGPLRNSIRTLREGQETTEFKRLKVYRNVRFIKCFPSWKGIQYMVTFDTASLKVKLPRRLLYGNLVCLSSDRFQDDLIFATIAHRTLSKVKQGIIGLEFLESSNDDTKQFRDFRQRKRGYTMIECDSHYLATKSVLNGLKDLRTLPLQDKIVSCTPHLSTPAYLNRPEQVKLDFTSLTGDKKHKNVQLLNIKMWPKPEEMGLNEEQRSAVHSALTTDLAVIQGGAGTGKSKVGNTIMKLLSQNQHLWNTQKQQICPILVICYGNQALDQFLEEIVDFFPDKILRVGGRCRNDKLHCFTMAHIKRQTELKASKTERYDYWITRGD
ncbi:NFX1-type zinc finger-containing protein 1-like [Ciona intestinalis]